jgi:hypothetical protein
MTEISPDLLWWVTVVDLPALSGLLWLIWRTRCETQAEVKAVNYTLDLRCDQLREGLHAFKLEVAKTYASQQDLRVIEGRLVEHLLRIEAKLDATALKAEGLAAKGG